MPKKTIFDDGSIVEWIDRETLKYTTGDYSVLVWVDFEPGFFAGGRILKASSINKWDAKPKDAPSLIGKDTKQEIIKKILKYYDGLNKKCTVDTSPVEE